MSLISGAESFIHEVECPHFFAVFVIFFMLRVRDQIQQLKRARDGVVDCSRVHQRRLLVVWGGDFDEQTVRQTNDDEREGPHKGPDSRHRENDKAQCSKE